MPESRDLNAVLYPGWAHEGEDVGDDLGDRHRDRAAGTAGAPDEFGLILLRVIHDVETRLWRSRRNKERSSEANGLCDKSPQRDFVVQSTHAKIVQPSSKVEYGEYPGG